MGPLGLKLFNLFRAIYKYILITQLDALRRNETGALLMHNYDAAFESTNTIFARLCRYVFLFYRLNTNLPYFLIKNNIKVISKICYRKI